MGGDGVLVCTYAYLHIWWVFRVAFKKRWLLLTDQRSEDRQLSSAELGRMFPAGPPQLGFWESYGLVAALAAVLLIAVVSNLSASGY